MTDTTALISQRQSDYDTPRRNFDRIAGMLSALGYCAKQSDSILRPIVAEDVPILMIVTKLAREYHKHKDDNVDDIIGYARCLDQLVNENAP